MRPDEEIEEVEEEAADATEQPPESGEQPEPEEPSLEEALEATVAALQREKADFLNYKKRVHREKEDVRLAASRAWAETLLPVLDNLELALQSGGDHDALKQGVQMILHEFDRALGMLGVEPIAAEPGAAFDPDRHEAFGQVPHDELPPGSIAVVLQRGFSYHGRVLRAARVQVVAPNQSSPEAGEHGTGQGPESEA